MKRILKLIFTFLMFHSMLLSQGINNLWTMGYGGLQTTLPLGGVDMNFISGTPVISYITREMEFRRAVSNICDSSGNLLFVTNGVYIADATGDTMQNGSGLNPSVYTSWYPGGLPPPQMNIIIPDPGNSNLYYLFHTTIDDPPSAILSRYLYYSIVDMSQNSGLGAVTLKNQVLINDSLGASNLTACKHANGRDWWLVSHKAYSNLFYKFLISSYGIQGPFIQPIGNLRKNYLGQAAFSPNGNYYACYNLRNQHPAHFEFFNFDRCTGLFSNAVFMALDSTTGVGVAFSPNSQFLYVSSLDTVYQFDVTATNIPATQTTVAVWDGYYSPNPPFGTYFDIAQLAPDGKIYIGTGNSTLHLHVINQSDSAGLACDLVQHGIPLPAFNYNSLPNHPNYFLGALVGSPCDSLTGLNDDLAFDFKFVVYPNPNSGVFNIGYQLPQNKPGLIEILDINGKLLWSRNLPAWSSTQKIMHNDRLPQGFYIIRITSDNKFATQKLIIYDN